MSPTGWTNEVQDPSGHASASIVAGGANSGAQYWKVTSTYDGVRYLEKALLQKTPASIVVRFAFTIDSNPSGFVTVMRISTSKNGALDFRVNTGFNTDLMEQILGTGPTWGHPLSTIVANAWHTVEVGYDGNQITVGVDASGAPVDRHVDLGTPIAVSFGSVVHQTSLTTQLGFDDVVLR
jgi:hypothetical protein